jgi:hypothetical protein
MGHKTVAGRISKEEMLGKPMLRIDIPGDASNPQGFTQMYGEAAIYCVTFVSEEVARRVAGTLQVKPVSVYCPNLITVEQASTFTHRLPVGTDVDDDGVDSAGDF